MTPAEIRATREALGLTQSEFAERIGCQLRAVQRWEQDSDGPSSRQPRGAALTVLKLLQQEAKRKHP